MARQTDNADIVAEIFAAKLCADAKRLCQFVNFGFHFQITESMTSFGTLRWQTVEITRRCQFHSLQIHFSGRAANNDCQMIGRAGRCAEAEDLVLEEVDHAVMRQQRWRALKQKSLVGRTAALSYKQELIGVFAFFIDVDLSRQIVLGVLFFEHRKGASCE